MSLFDLIEEARLLGPRNLAFRVRWEAANRSGLRAMLRPIGDAPEPTELPPFRTWFGRLPTDHPLRRVAQLVQGPAAEALRQLHDQKALDEIIARADRIEQGELELFGAFWAEFGSPPNWHLEPRRRRSWARSAHWSTLLSHEDRNGDIKLTWEVNRFLHVYDLIRAYALDQKASRVETFVQHLRSWEEANPFRAGVNWASGQELAVRVLSWSYGVAAFGHHPAFTDDDFQRYIRLVHSHATHIEAHMGFAQRAVANNHLLAEALGLFVVASLFDFDDSPRWEALAWDVLEGEALEQFDADGGYCQNSHTYERFALQMWLEIVRWTGRSRYRLLPLLRRANDFLQTFASPAGRMPNWGNNDGSMLARWSPCDYQDFRPLFASLTYTVEGRRLAESGPWNEALLWRFGPRALEASRQRPATEHAIAFSSAGLVQLGDEMRAILRCGPMHQRTGHADQLHLDVWFGDREVACDAGSYSYHYDSKFHRWASGPASHNEVTIDGVSTMRLLRKFKWHGFEPGRLVEVSESAMEATLPPLEKLGVRWRRRVQVLPDRVVVDDEVVSVDGDAHQIRLHWLLAGADWSQDGNKLTRDGVEVTIEHDDGFIDITEGTDGEVEGWQARYYGDREVATSVAVRCRTSSTQFRTTFRREG